MDSCLSGSYPSGSYPSCNFPLYTWPSALVSRAVVTFGHFYHWYLSWPVSCLSGSYQSSSYPSGSCPLGTCPSLLVSREVVTVGHSSLGNCPDRAVINLALIRRAVIRRAVFPLGLLAVGLLSVAQLSGYHGSSIPLSTLSASSKDNRGSQVLGRAAEETDHSFHVWSKMRKSQLAHKTRGFS